LVAEKLMAYVVRTVLRSGILTRGATSYDDLRDAMRAAGTQLEKGYAADAWIEAADGTKVADVSAIKRECNLD
jgi:hypothetical protein